MESERADEAETANAALTEEVKTLRPTTGQKAAAAVGAAAGGMASWFNRPAQPQQNDGELADNVADMQAAVEAANLAKNALNSALNDTVSAADTVPCHHLDRLVPAESRARARKTEGQ